MAGAHTGPDYFPFYPDSFAGDGLVEAMTTEEVGAYILLLCKAWREEPAGSVPNDDRLLARWSRLSFTKFKRSREKILSPFLIGDDGRLHQKRMIFEYDRVMSKSSKARQSAELRWKNAERSKHGRNANASESEAAKGMRTHSEGNAIKAKGKYKGVLIEPSRARGTQLALDGAEPESPRHPAGAVAEFISAYRVRYPEDPSVNSAVAVMLSNLRKKEGEEKFRKILACFIADDDPFVTKTAHRPLLLASVIDRIKAKLNGSFSESPRSAQPAGKYPKTADYSEFEK